jgi:hypothetical protein
MPGSKAAEAGLVTYRFESPAHHRLFQVELIRVCGGANCVAKDSCIRIARVSM